MSKKKKITLYGHVMVGDIVQFTQDGGPLIVRKLNEWHEFVVTRQCTITIDNE